ncbi:hypothetical protein [Deinococcus sp. QL22]|uniref:hypothetical protein n=1 Tax=Deinococcus sp. QL22 TaxID=2939437 RepID=UPI002016AA1A|nr:hypothetical protein [Deinococcus sp. QL22]
MPADPQIHLSLGPNGQVIWQRGSGPVLMMYLLQWGMSAGWTLQLEVQRDFDERGDWLTYTVSVAGVCSHTASDPLTATLQSLAQANNARL